MMKIISLIIASVLALSLAALSGAYWHVELASQPDWQSKLAIAGSVCVSLMTFACAYHIRSHGRSLVLAVSIFFAADAYQNTQGWQMFQSLSSSTELETAKERLTTAKDQLLNLPTPDANGAIRKDSTHANTTERLTANIALFQADVEQLEKPSTPPLYVAIAMGLIQIALSIFFAAMGKPKKQTEMPAKPVETESDAGTDQTNVLVFSHRPTPMDKNDLKAWHAISRQA